MSKQYQRHHLTAIIRNKHGGILAIGKNSYIKTHPMMSKIAARIGIFDNKRTFIHAEIDALVKCDNLSKAYSIEIYGHTTSGNPGINTKPCPICMTGIRCSGIKKVIYMNENLELVCDNVSPTRGALK